MVSAVEIERKLEKMAEEELKNLKPLPLVPIPDNPPPHEGAMIDIPYVVEPPDFIMVELLEALPGRPISGVRLVRPDGTVTLGFYGDVNLRGLTLAQSKTKIILHLRRFLDDKVLGLARLDPEGPEQGGLVESLSPPSSVGPTLPDLPKSQRKNDSRTLAARRQHQHESGISHQGRRVMSLRQPHRVSTIRLNNHLSGNERS